MTSATKLILLTFVVLHCGLVRAENLWVLGSYLSQTSADKRQALLENTLGLSVHQHAVELDGVTHYRLLAGELNLTSNQRQHLVQLGIEPWMIKLDDALVSRLLGDRPPVARAARNLETPSAFQLLLVGEFPDVDQALVLERKLTQAGLPVRGEARLIAGGIMHTVWVGPVKDSRALRQKLETQGFSASQTKDASAADSAFAARTSPTPASSMGVPSISAPSTSARSASVNSQSKPETTKQYPKDYNLARLPEKPPAMPKIP
tara:strand:+ start:93 stop:878 length:786 start_codon:yes stop_codon:yes gene_type:complete